VDSCDLRVGDEVLLRDGQIAPVQGMDYRSFEGTVYNMEVDELQCYTVGSNSVLVHNSNGEQTGPTEPPGPQTPADPNAPGLPRGAGTADNPPPSNPRIESNGLNPNNPAAASASRTAIEALADSYRGLSNSQRPATVARLVPREGSPIAGRSVSRNPIHEVITDYYADRPAHPNNLQCAEIDAISQALRAHEAATGTRITTLEQARAVLQGSRIQTASVRRATGSNPARLAEHGRPVPPCPNGCDLLLRDLGIVYE
jgi:hypothetical protein